MKTKILLLAIAVVVILVLVAAPAPAFASSGTVKEILPSGIAKEIEKTLQELPPRSSRF